MDEKQNIFESYEVPDPVRLQKVIKFAKKYFGKWNGLTALELGVTRGGVADFLSRKGSECWGVDVNSRELEGVRVLQADLNRGIPEIERKFDFIFAGEVMEHLFDDRKFLRECRDLLRKGGLLAITVPNLTSFFNRFLLFFGQMPLTAYAAAEFHYHVYTRKKLRQMVEEEGFEVIKITSSYVPLNVLSKIWGLGKIFVLLGDIFPTMGNQLIVFARSKS